MKSRFLWAIAFVSLCLTGMAQIIDEPLRVMVKFKLASGGSGSHNVELTGLPLPAGAPVPFNKGNTVDYYSTAIEVGKNYTVTLTPKTGATSSSLTIAQPPGYTLWMGTTAEAPLAKNKVTTAGAAVTYNIRLQAKSEALDMPVGESTSLRGGGIHWQVSLGKLRNGNPAGAISLIASGSGQEAEPWASIFNASALSYVSDSSGVTGDREIQVYRNPVGAISQIRTNEAYVNVVLATAPDGFTGFWLKVYRRDQAGVPGNTVFPVTVFSGEPFVAYKVQRVSATKLRIVKEIRNNDAIGSPIERTQWTSMERTIPDSASPYNLSWKVWDWNETPVDVPVGAPASENNVNIRVREVVWSNADAAGNRLETHTTRYNGSSAVVSRMRRQVTFNDKTGEKFTNIELGEDNAQEIATAIGYHTSESTSAAKMSYGLVDSVTTNGGAVTSYTYNSSTDTAIGTIAAQTSTYLDGIDPITPSLTRSLRTSYMYVADPWGMERRPMAAFTYLVSKYTPGGYSSRVVAQSDTFYEAGTALLVIGRKRDYASAPSDPFDPVNPSHVETIIKYYREDLTDVFLRNQPYSIAYPNGDKVSYLYQHGNLNADNTTFTPGVTSSHLASQITIYYGRSAAPAGMLSLARGAVNGASDLIYMVENRSTHVVIRRDRFARLVRVDTYGYVKNAAGTAAEESLINTETFDYSYAGALRSKIDANGGEYTANYSGHRLLNETLPSGETYTYLYEEVNGRLWKVVKEGSPLDTRTLVTEFSYDAADRVTQKKVYSGAAAAGEALISAWSFDTAGRVTSASSPGVSAIQYTYEPANNRFKATYPAPSGITSDPYVYVSSYKDGRPKASWGTATVKQATEYSFTADGKAVTETIIVGDGTDDSIPAKVARSRWKRTTSDWLGRPVEERQPGPHTPVGKDQVTADVNVTADQLAIVKSYSYNLTTGLPTKITQTSAGDTLFKYNAVNELIEVGVDVTKDGVLTPGSADRIMGTDSMLTKIGGQWWSEAKAYTYGINNDARAHVLSINRTRLSGYTTSGLVKAESFELDQDENSTTSLLEVVRGAKSAKLRFQVRKGKNQDSGIPLALNESSQEFENGLLRKSNGADLNWSAIIYDDLYRPKQTTTKRITQGLSLISYKSGTELVESLNMQTDAAASWAPVTTNTYNLLGLLESTTTDATGATAYFKYNARGQVIQSWGSGRYPEQTDYNAFGDVDKFYSFRGAGFAGSTFPSPLPIRSEYSLTEFIYTDSGFLAKKRDDDAKEAVFSYTLDGQAKTREWARLVGGSGPSAAEKVKATYTYSDNTRELAGVTYNDGTPAVTLGYSRMGAINQVSDATGTRSFSFDAGMPWREDAEYLPAFFRDRMISRYYQSPSEAGLGKLSGRAIGFSLGSLADPGKLLSNYNEISGTGRIDSIIAGSGISGLGRRFNYGYHANASLITSITAKGHAVTPGESTAAIDFVTNKQYESSRDVLTQISAQRGSVLLSQFSYITNLVGQRETVQKAGKLYTDAYGVGNPLYDRYGYNLRGEVEAAKTFSGTVTAMPLETDGFPGRKFNFLYDSAGNRTKSGRGTAVMDDNYTINGMNQIVGRENKALSISGVANSQAAIEAEHTPDDVALAVANAVPARMNRYWQLELGNAGAAPLSQQIDVINYKAGATPDQAYIDRRYVYHRPKNEVRTHDADGNLVEDGMWFYKWDAENRLVQMHQKAWVRTAYGDLRKRLEFQYDYMGRRVSKVVKTTTSAVEVPLDVEWAIVGERRFIYDGWNLIAEFNPSLSTSAAPDADLVRSYAWGLNEGGVLSTLNEGGTLLEVTDHETKMSYFPGYDGNGNVVSLTRAADGLLVAEYEYGPFGEPLRQTGACAKLNPFRFGTKYTDDESGLVYYGLRYYEPRNGRFINRDPIGEAGGSNLYGFVGNDAVNGQDILGLYAISDGFSSGPIVIGGGSGNYNGSNLTPGDVGGSRSGGSNFSVSVSGPSINDYLSHELSQPSGGKSSSGSGGKKAPPPSNGIKLDSIKNVSGYRPDASITPGSSIGYGVATQGLLYPSSSLVTAQNYSQRMDAPFPTTDDEIQITGAYQAAMIEREQMFDAVLLGFDVATILPSAGLSKAGTSIFRSGLRRMSLSFANDLAPVSARGFGAIGIDRIATGVESAALRKLYLDESASLMFRAKLATYNLFSGSRITAAQVTEGLMLNADFRLVSKLHLSNINLVGGRFVVGGVESMGYINRTVAHHEMLHFVQFSNNPFITTRGIKGLFHEVLPSFIGTPEIYGGATLLIGGGVLYSIPE